jgi:DNA-binding transcriptional LysR family regulator
MDLGYPERCAVLDDGARLAGGLFLICNSDLVGLVPERIGRDALTTLGLRTFEIPLNLPALEISMAWHPRFDADGAHRWLRQCVRDAMTEP